MQAIYNSISNFISNISSSSEFEIQESFNGSAWMFTSVLLIAVGVPEANINMNANLLRPISDSYRDLTASQVVERFELQLPSARKADSKKLGKLVYRLSKKHKLSPGLILAVIESESSFRYEVRSKAGAVGIMQLLPSTAEYVAKLYNIRSYKDETDLKNPEINIKLGVAYLAYLKKKFGSSIHYLAAYNMGPTALRRRFEKGQMDLGAIEGYVRKIQSRTLEFRADAEDFEHKALLPRSFKVDALIAGRL